ncbi:DUF6326 family protein [Nocardiopsis valliformis]|uniref:DUF6326 family protein n=1 Tax=Nocardiopsis valliformis TaxID=239974 RepID=UPI00034BF005|nr:DUF6326 family protein [Nocardiopsis valliformis]
MTALTETAPDRRVVLSTLWIVLVLNYLYCDVLVLHDPEHLEAIRSGVVAGIEFTPGFLVGAGLLMQIPILMVLLSRVLRRRVNRWANIVAAAVMAVVQVSTLFLEGTPAPVYVFFSVIEIALLLVVIGYAVTWTRTETAKVPQW